ncbi:ligand-binding sensor domain-containing protein [Chryseolinea lacunae]|uniref:Histidine kinase domain-containing protein n=1 Tax=Chryseolinea lacunae TaxID=2801331 RepID=A0ABS1KL00_9BACT|nr:sensor histidine kinase [Chryseolinea lacunae]MBL0739902.1 hypothetical protein [Chryseolinea lacunae]
MNRVIFFRVAFVLAVVWPLAPSRAQLPAFRFEVITTKEGLPSNTVLSAKRDHTGFMWFGTRLCPVRYNGATFQSFREPETNFVTSLAIDKDDNIWFASDRSGVCRIDAQRMKMDSLPHTTENIQTGDFFIDSNGTGWFSNRFGVNRLDLKTNVLKHYPFTQTNFVWNKASFAEDADHTLWAIGRDNGLFRYDAKKDSFICVWGSDCKDPARRELIMQNKAYADKDGFLWIASFNLGLIRYNTRTDERDIFETERLIKEVRAVEEGVDEYGRRIFWVGDEHGLGIFRPDQKKFYYFHNIIEEPYEVYDIFRDPEEGIVWVCTSKGIIKYHPHGNIFQARALPRELVRHPVDVNVILSDKRPGQDNIHYLGLSHTGMIRWDRSTDKFLMIPYPAATADTRWMAQRNDGTIWIGTNRGDYVRPGIFVYDPDKEKFVTSPLSNLANTFFSVPFFMNGGFDSQNRLWIGNSDEGIHVLDAEGQKDESPWSAAVQHAVFSNNNLMTSMLMDSKGRTWLGTYNGVIRADERQAKFLSPDSSILPKSIADWAVTSMMEDRQGNIWAARWGSLTQMSGEGKLITAFTTANGFYDRENRGLVEDRSGNLWMGNYEGLYCIHPESKRILRFTTNDGLVSNNTAGRIGLSNDGRRLFIGQINAFNFVNVEQLLRPSEAPPLAISSFKVHEQERYPDFNKRIVLDRADNTFSVDFISLNYRKHQDNQYAYYLEGFEKEWHASGSEHQAYYTNLNPGTYTLHLKAGDAFGNWNYGTLTMKVEVLPAYYETWWFKTLMVLIVAALLYALYRYRINQLLHLQNIRNRISADLHDELGSSLSSISIMGAMAQTNLASQHPSKPMLERMVEEIRQISGTLDDIVWNISPKNDSLSNLIARMTRYASELFEAKQINFRYTLPEHLEQMRLSMEQRRNFYLIFKESVNNLVKYSCCTEAFINIAIENKNLLLTIGDNGKGFDPEAASDRNGLQNLRVRADNLKGKIEIRSTPGKGTTIVLKFPLRLGDPNGLLTISPE